MSLSQQRDVRRKSPIDLPHHMVYVVTAKEKSGSACGSPTRDDQFLSPESGLDRLASHQLSRYQTACRRSIPLTWLYTRPQTIMATRSHYFLCVDVSKLRSASMEIATRTDSSLSGRWQQDGSIHSVCRRGRYRQRLCRIRKPRRGELFRIVVALWSD